MTLEWIAHLVTKLLIPPKLKSSMPYSDAIKGFPVQYMGTLLRFVPRWLKHQRYVVAPVWKAGATTWLNAKIELAQHARSAPHERSKQPIWLASFWERRAL